jgi:hypothetical protein
MLAVSNIKSISHNLIPSCNLAVLRPDLPRGLKSFFSIRIIRDPTRHRPDQLEIPIHHSEVPRINQELRKHLPNLPIALYQVRNAGELENRKYLGIVTSKIEQNIITIPIAERYSEHDLKHASNWCLYPQSAQKYTIEALKSAKAICTGFNRVLRQHLNGRGFFPDQGAYENFRRYYLNQLESLRGSSAIYADNPIERMSKGRNFDFSLRKPNFSPKNSPGRYGRDDFTHITEDPDYFPNNVSVQVGSSIEGIGNNNPRGGLAIQGSLVTNLTYLGKVVNMPPYILSQEDTAYLKAVTNRYPR